MQLSTVKVVPRGHRLLVNPDGMLPGLALQLHNYLYGVSLLNGISKLPELVQYSPWQPKKCNANLVNLMMCNIS